MSDVLHTIIDVLAGRRNLAAHQADELHEAITPGYTKPLPTAADVAAAQAVLAAAQEAGEHTDRPAEGSAS